LSGAGSTLAKIEQSVPSEYVLTGSRIVPALKSQQGYEGTILEK
jgi:hypothetical protein